jgi:hypothetical protein
MKIVISDLKDLWSLYGNVVDVLIQKDLGLLSEGTSSLSSLATMEKDRKQEMKELIGLINFYQNHREEVSNSSCLFFSFFAVSVLTISVLKSSFLIRSKIIYLPVSKVSKR